MVSVPFAAICSSNMLLVAAVPLKFKYSIDDPRFVTFSFLRSPLAGSACAVVTVVLLDGVSLTIMSVCFENWFESVSALVFHFAYFAFEHAITITHLDSCKLDFLIG